MKEGSKFDMVEDSAPQTIMENCKYLTLLMNSELTSMTFSQLPLKENEDEMKSVTDVWFAMSNKCLKLQELYCDAISDSVYHHTKDDTRESVVFFSFSVQFTELLVLEMPNMVCNDFRLQMLVEYLPNLRCVCIHTKI